MAPSGEDTHGASRAECPVPAAAPVLNRLPAATVFAPLDVSSTLLERTHHRVVATNHHRAEAAMRDVILTFTGSPERARALIGRRGAGYVLLCPGLTEVRQYADKAPHGFAAQLLAGRVPGWLEPVDLSGSPELKLWRVVG